MAKFENKITELGLQHDTLSKALKIDINEYYNAEKELEDLQSSLKNADDEEKESIQDEIKELKEVLNDFDDLIIQKIEKLDKNKDFYEERMKKMAEGREKAKQAKAQGVYQPKQKQQIEAQPTQTQPTQAQPTIKEENSKVENNEEIKEEKKDWSWLILAGIVGAVTLGAVILRKK
jgi:DNA repair exonuclease SbcCD ATPase subunit